MVVFNNRLVIGGYQFTDIDGQSCGGLAAYDGTWHTFNRPPNGGYRGVGSLAVLNNQLYASEERSSVAGGNTVRFDGQVEHTLGNGFDGGAYASIVYNGDLIVAGDFTRAGDIDAANIARWDGAVWRPLGSGTDGRVYSLAVYNGDLYAGGIFNTAGGQSTSSIARWDGAAWHNLPGTTANAFGGGVRAMTVYNNELFIGLGYYFSDGVSGSAGAARWNGATWLRQRARFPRHRVRHS